MTTAIPNIVGTFTGACLLASFLLSIVAVTRPVNRNKLLIAFNWTLVLNACIATAVSACVPYARACSEMLRCTCLLPLLGRDQHLVRLVETEEPLCQGLDEADFRRASSSSRQGKRRRTGVYCTICQFCSYLYVTLLRLAVFLLRILVRLDRDWAKPVHLPDSSLSNATTEGLFMTALGFCADTEFASQQKGCIDEINARTDYTLENVFT